jgi:hypothetical protein
MGIGVAKFCGAQNFEFAIAKSKEISGKIFAFFLPPLDVFEKNKRPFFSDYFNTIAKINWAFRRLGYWGC